MGEEKSGVGGESAAAAAAVEKMTVNIRCSNGSKFTADTVADATIREFKELLAGQCDVPAPQQRLIYKGRVLKDDHTLQSYGLESNDTIHLVRGFATSTSSTNTSTSAEVSATPNNSGAASVLGVGEGGGFGASSIFQGLGANGSIGGGPFGLLGTGLPELDQMQQQLRQNPGLIREMMNSPIFQSLLNNPDVMRNMIMSNPQIRELMERNPEFAHVLNDPSTLRQTIEVARNPELMREMMRNTDRAMSNIESMPEGFNMLRRMYENVQEPFLNAATMAGDTGRESVSNPFSALLGNQGGSQTRDAVQNPSNTSEEPSATSPAPNTNPLPNPWGTGGAQQTTTRSATAPDTRQPSGIGLPGPGFQNLEQMFGGLQGASSFSQFMQNPAVSQMMQSILSDPQYMNQLLGRDPQMQSLLDNPQVRELLQNPQFLRQLTSPETLQQLLTVQQTFQSLFGRQQTTPGQSQTGEGMGGTGTAQVDVLMNLFGGLGAGGFGAQNTLNVPPEELYATQLTQLQEMGFFDTQENIRALRATFGNVNAAVERLLGNPDQ